MYDNNTVLYNTFYILYITKKTIFICIQTEIIFYVYLFSCYNNNIMFKKHVSCSAQKSRI